MFLKKTSMQEFKATHDFVSDKEPENFKFENLIIREEWDNANGKQKNEAEVKGKSTEARKRINKISHLSNSTKKKENIITRMYY